jgi:N-acylglucosamine 2-epimerase
MEGTPPRCVFLTDAKGDPKAVTGHEGYDLSISADCFVVMGFAAYARATADADAWRFAKELGESVFERYESGNYRSLPYPVPSGYRTHAKPMLLTNLLSELYRAALRFDANYAEGLKARLAACHNEVFEVFAKDGLVREFVYADGKPAPHLFGMHINPGHTLEDMWFQWEASALLGDDRYRKTIEEIVRRTMALGWDAEYGGLYHFVPCDGLATAYEVAADTKDEPQMRLVLDDWGSKLWWVHSEAMYTNLLLYTQTEDEEFLSLFQKVFDYTYRTFPNPDRTLREWIQIRRRDGAPQDKVVALPVKDPYHIIRNVLLIIELLERQIHNESTAF